MDGQKKRVFWALSDGRSTSDVALNRRNGVEFSRWVRWKLLHEPSTFGIHLGAKKHEGRGPIMMKVNHIGAEQRTGWWQAPDGKP